MNHVAEPHLVSLPRTLFSFSWPCWRKLRTRLFLCVGCFWDAPENQAPKDLTQGRCFPYLRQKCWAHRTRMCMQWQAMKPIASKLSGPVWRRGAQGGAERGERVCEEHCGEAFGSADMQDSENFLANWFASPF